MFKTSRGPAPISLPLRPPRCSPAWSHVQDQPPPHRATSSSPATTLLASVEPCSRPAIAPPQCVQHREHRSTLASSVVANRSMFSRISLVVNTAPRWQAAWWRRGGYLRKVVADSTLRIGECRPARQVPPKREVISASVATRQTAVARGRDLQPSKESVKRPNCRSRTWTAHCRDSAGLCLQRGPYGLTASRLTESISTCSMPG